METPVGAEIIPNALRAWNDPEADNGNRERRLGIFKEERGSTLLSYRLESHSINQANKTGQLRMNSFSGFSHLNKSHGKQHQAVQHPTW